MRNFYTKVLGKTWNLMENMPGITTFRWTGAINFTIFQFGAKDSRSLQGRGAKNFALQDSSVNLLFMLVSFSPAPGSP